MLRIIAKIRLHLSKPSHNNNLFYWFHKGLGAMYLCALFPLFFQIKALIGNNGLLDANVLIHQSYADQGLFKSVLQFPSLFHFYPHDSTLYILLAIGCAGALLLLAGYKQFTGALLAWVSFLSITSIGGDFFVIIIDLFLAEAGFLALFSTYSIERYGHLPRIIDLAFRLLNFRLWFCMGVNKFYMPLDVWTNFTFFNYFFHAQPMPSPLAPYFHALPKLLKDITLIAFFISETLVPFFVFGKKRLRIIAFYTFVIVSIFIQLNGNYGYFNLLSIVLALLILKDDDINFKIFKKMKLPLRNKIKLPRIIVILLCIQMSLQVAYCIYVFNPRPHSPQNQFNYLFTTQETKTPLASNLLFPLKCLEYWRICNPYGVFRGIPYHHGEIRISGSYDGKNWKNYAFNYLPAAYTDYLGFYAPYYPRLDHLFFYETLAAQNYKWNPLNKYYTEKNCWVARFINKLLKNDNDISRRLKFNPFENKQAPVYIKTEVYRLSFSKKNNRHWDEKPMNFIKLFSDSNKCKTPLVSFEEAMKTTYGMEDE